MMFHRANRLIVFVLSTWAILIAGPSWSGISVSADANNLPIRFDELEIYARTNSPQMRILAEELLKLHAERDDALQWSNPELGYDREAGETFQEWQFTLRKRLVMPFAQAKARDGWTDRIRSGELQADQSTSNLLSELKTGYVHLSLLEEFLLHLELLDGIVMEAAESADNRYNEGDMSGVESHLIQLSALSIDAAHRNVVQELGEVTAYWTSEMGIPFGSNTDLVTPIVFQPVELESPTDYLARLEDRPGIQSLAVLQQALGKQAAAARPSLIPGLDVYAGYRRFDPQLEGYVAGIAMSLPIFDRNAAAARIHRAEERIVENELARLRARTAGEIEALVHLIGDAEHGLSTLHVQLKNDPPMMSKLLYSYQDGRLTLDAFLNAIQIEVAGMSDYYDQLNGYYRNIFRLEAITGAQIVSFER